MIEHEQIFRSETPSKRFARYRCLSRKDCEKLSAELFKELEIPRQTEMKDTLKLACSNSRLLIEKFEGTGREILNLLIIEVGYKPISIFVNYDMFEKIYEIATSEFIKYFGYLYYPGADDIEIFDERRCWLLQLNHEEELLILKGRLPTVSPR
jgi:hypothetical protein